MKNCAYPKGTLENFTSRCEIEATAGGIQTTVAELDACAARIESAVPKCGDAPVTCVPTRGTLATGESCTFDNQCASSFCAPGSDGRGRCFDEKKPRQSHAKHEQRCSLGPHFDAAEGTSYGDCPNDSYCHPGRRVCVLVAKAGEACDGMAEFSCAGDSRCLEGRCKAKLPAAPCSSADDCVGGETCAEGRCRAPRNDRKEGESCSTGLDYVGDTCAAGLCVAGDDRDWGTCRTDAGHLGQPCVDAGRWDTCVAPAICTYSMPKTCKMPSKIGEACDYMPGCVVGARCEGWTPRQLGRCVVR